MSAIRDELHFLVDQLPEERLAPVLRLIRGEDEARREAAAATLARVQQRMRGVTSADEELLAQRNGGRG